MATWNRDVRRSSLGFDTRSLAERSAAVESLRNFANFSVQSETETKPDLEVDQLVGEVRTAGGSILIVDLAKRLGWDADRLSAALARAGNLGRLAFTKEGGRTLAALPPAAT